MIRYKKNSPATQLGSGVAFLAITFLFLVVCFAG